MTAVKTIKLIAFRKPSVVVSIICIVYVNYYYRKGRCTNNLLVNHVLYGIGCSV